MFTLTLVIVAHNSCASSGLPKIADPLRAALRLRGYSYRTEQAYLQRYPHAFCHR